MRTFPATVLFRDSCVRCAATSDGSAKLNAGREKPHFSPGVDRTLCRRSGGKVESTGWGQEEVRSREPMASRPRTSDRAPCSEAVNESPPVAGRPMHPPRGVAPPLAIAPRLCLAYICEGRLARRAPRPPGSVRGFIHHL